MFWKKSTPAEEKQEPRFLYALIPVTLEGRQMYEGVGVTRNISSSYEQRRSSLHLTDAADVKIVRPASKGIDGYKIYVRAATETDARKTLMEIYGMGTSVGVNKGVVVRLTRPELTKLAEEMRRMPSLAA